MIKRVLIADDNVDAAESLQLWLEMAGHEVHIALTGPAALKLAETVHPEVALLDVGMPGMSGLEVAAKIREAPWGREMVLDRADRLGAGRGSPAHARRPASIITSPSPSRRIRSRS